MILFIKFIGYEEKVHLDYWIHYSNEIPRLKMDGTNVHHFF